jgi:hypothetical protein
MLTPIVNTRRKVHRNEPCPFCTSGIKFKKCHGAPIKGPAPEGSLITTAVHKGPRPAMRKVIK